MNKALYGLEPVPAGRYDGHELKKYVHQADDPHSIPHNFIYQMIEDEQNNIWILTDKGVARYRRQSDDFFIPTNESGNNIIVYSVCLTKGGVLFGSKNKIFFYNYQDASLRLLQSFEREPNYNVTLLTFGMNIPCSVVAGGRAYYYST